MSNQILRKASFRDVIKKYRVRDVGLHISEEEIYRDLVGKFGQSAFLGKFSTDEVEALLRKHGVLEKIHRISRQQPVLNFFLDDPEEHALHIVERASDADRLFLELVLRRLTLEAYPLYLNDDQGPPLSFLYIEWMLLQNPYAKFERRHLPGQQFPGLGLAKNMMLVLQDLCTALQFDGLMAVPGHYHNAVLFSEYFRYLDPQLEGCLEALRRDLSNYSLSDISWAVELNCVQQLDCAQPFEWFLGWQAYAVGENLRQYFQHPEYEQKKTAAREQHHFRLAKDTFLRLKEHENVRQVVYEGDGGK